MLTANLNSITNMRYVGPANTDFGSFRELVLYSLNSYCPGWNEYEEGKAQNYFIPRIFEFKHPEIPDADIDFLAQKLEKASADPLYKHRSSDEAERIIYRAVYQLSQDEFLAPFIVAHNLDVHKIKNRLKSIFPDLKPDHDQLLQNLGEFDFICIGPKIGIAIIEVKYSNFTQTKHFSPRSRFLPEIYHDGLKQLNSADDFLKFLAKFTGVELPVGMEIKKALFTPNLKEGRFKKWFDQLDEYPKGQVETKLKPVTTWFEEHLQNSPEDSTKVPLYTKFRDLLEKGNAISREIYESYAVLIAGLASVVLFETKDLRLDTANFSIWQGILKESERIECQDPTGEKMKELNAQAVENTTTTEYAQSWEVAKAYTTYTTHATEIFQSTAPKRPKLSDPRSVPSISFVPSFEYLQVSRSKAIFLTPDQQRVLSGPPAQFVIGAAGTGKTIILQAKALDMLRRQQSVLVLAPKCYVQKYRDLFEAHDVMPYLYEVKSWQEKRRMMASQLLGDYIRIEASLDLLDETKIYADIRREIAEGRLSHVFNWLSHFDHVFIDDAFDECEQDSATQRLSDVATFATMAFVRLACPLGKVLWIAMDSWIPDQTSWFGAEKAGTKATGKSLVSTFLGNCDISRSNSKISDEDVFQVGILTKVMRCSQTVFEMAYPKDAGWSENNRLFPTLGHKIYGLPPVVWTIHRGDLKEAKETILKTIQDELDHLKQQSIDLDKTAIIVQDSKSDYGQLQRTIMDLVGKEPSKTFASDDDQGPGPPSTATNGTNSQEASTSRKRKLDVDSTAGHDEGHIQPAVCNWDDVSSLEWPVVIYVSCVPGNPCADRDPERTLYEYARYRACSRATSMLVIIEATYYDPKLVQEETTSPAVEATPIAMTENEGTITEKSLENIALSYTRTEGE